MDINSTYSPTTHNTTVTTIHNGQPTIILIILIIITFLFILFSFIYAFIICWYKNFNNRGNNYNKIPIIFKDTNVLIPRDQTIIDQTSIYNTFTKGSIEFIIYQIMKLKNNKFNYSQVISQISSDRILKSDTKNVLIRLDGYHPVLKNVGLEDFITNLWNMIIRSKHANAIKNIMNIEITSAIIFNTCINGRFARLVNCLNGFNFMSQKINVIEYNDQDIIASIIIKTKCTPASKHKMDARMEMIERGYSEDIIEIWINAIEDD